MKKWDKWMEAVEVMWGQSPNPKLYQKIAP
jgi:hypothetical protein